jgi:hypothetical protein
MAVAYADALNRLFALGADDPAAEPAAAGRGRGEKAS